MFVMPMQGHPAMLEIQAQHACLAWMVIADVPL
jgi:hypothetical protein